MRAYSLTKKLAKIIIGFSVFTVCISAASYFYFSRFSADVNVGPCSISSPPSVSVKLKPGSNGGGTVTFGPNRTEESISYEISTNGTLLKRGILHPAPAYLEGAASNTNVGFTLAKPGSHQITVFLRSALNNCTYSTTSTVEYSEDTIGTEDCSVLPKASIAMPAENSVIKPGAGLGIRITNPSSAITYYADVSITDGKGTWSTPYSKNRIPKGTTNFSFNPTLEGKHHVGAKVYLNNCLIEEKQIQFCVSKGAPKCTAPDEVVGAVPGGPDGGGGVGSGGSTSTAALVEPEIKPSSLTTLKAVLDRIVPILSEVIGALCFIGLIVGGYMYITAGPNEAMAEKAKKTILYSIIGLVIAIFAAVIVTVGTNLLVKGK